jgi:hypothetical protein
MRQYLWGAILGTSYANWTGDPTQLKSFNPTCIAWTGAEWMHPFNNNGVGLPTAVSRQLFGGVDPSKAATDDTNGIGAVAPYFQEQYLAFKPVGTVNTSQNTGGCTAP